MTSSSTTHTGMPLTPQAARNAKPLVVAANYQCAHGLATRGAWLRRRQRAVTGPARRRPEHLPVRAGGASGVVRRVTACVSDRPPNHPPATNRMIGPKLQAAGAPRKCSPGTDDSIPGLQHGIAVDAPDPLNEPAVQEWVFGHIDPVAGTEHHVINVTVAAIVELDPDTRPNRRRLRSQPDRGGLERARASAAATPRRLGGSTGTRSGSATGAGVAGMRSARRRSATAP